MPYQTEHAARQTDPTGYVRFRRKHLTDGIDAVVGIKEDGGSEIQSIRFDAERFTPAASRRWLKEHDFRTELEVAKAATAEMLILRKSEPELRYTLGVVYEPDTIDTQQEFATADTIRDAAWGFLARLQGLAKSATAIVDAALSVEDGESLVVDISEVSDVLDALEKGAGLDDQHRQIDDDLGMIVESYLAPTDLTINGQVVKQGAWLLGVRWSEPMWAKIKAGERTGLSMFGYATRVEEAA
jgi:hypothetical protein